MSEFARIFMPGMLTGGAIAFVISLFYSRLRKRFSVPLHLAVPILIGFGVFWGPNLHELFNPGSEFLAWQILFIPIFSLGGFAGSLLGGLVVWKRRVSKEDSKREGALQLTQGPRPCPYCNSSDVFVSGVRLWCSSCNKFFDRENG